MGQHLKQARTLPAVPACLLLVFLTTIAAAAATAAGNGPEMEREAGGAARARHQHHRGLQQQQQPPHLRHNRSAPLPPRLATTTSFIRTHCNYFDWQKISMAFQLPGTNKHDPRPTRRLLTATSWFFTTFYHYKTKCCWLLYKRMCTLGDVAV